MACTRKQTAAQARFRHLPVAKYRCSAHKPSGSQPTISHWRCAMCEARNGRQAYMTADTSAASRRPASNRASTYMPIPDSITDARNATL